MGNLNLLVAVSSLFFLALVLGGFIWLVIYLARRNVASSSHAPPIRAGSFSENADARLRKLVALKEQGLINEEEYQQQRASIISSV